MLLASMVIYCNAIGWGKAYSETGFHYKIDNGKNYREDWSGFLYVVFFDFGLRKTLFTLKSQCPGQHGHKADIVPLNVIV